jgi:Zn-dependent protease with chaperone function
MSLAPNPESIPATDSEARAKILKRHQALAIGAVALPNLFLRSVCTLALLYGFLGLALITAVEFGYLAPTVAVGTGVLLVLLQFALGPWFTDLFLGWLRKTQWVEPNQLPDHLRLFVERVCKEHRFKFPSFGVIDDGAPEAFTYGHHPGNARIVISRGLREILTPDELEAVVAHELGHIRNWDMVLMTIANLVPLLLYYLYRMGARASRGKGDNKYAAAVSIGAYVLYFISQYVVLWFSRTREYHADRFAGQATGNPNSLASALVKIAYGLAARPSELVAAEGDADDKPNEAKKKNKHLAAGSGALGALNIFDRGAAVSLVMSSAHKPPAGSDSRVDPEHIKGAMQWDLWNPWASYYQLHSTHPLVAKRLLQLADQTASLGKTPYFIFDRTKPESYWDEFFIDLSVLLLPLLGGLLGAAIFVAIALATDQWHPMFFGLILTLVGFGALVKNRFVYARGLFENLTIAGLMHRVKVSPVRSVRATLTGTIIGKGVPGLIYSEDFVLRDSTGILFLDYQQPLAIWNFFFGLLGAGNLQGREIRASGWFRRAPVPYLELDRLEVLDSSEGPRRCYTSWAGMIASVILMLLGIVLMFWLT